MSGPHGANANVSTFDTLPAHEAAQLLESCCGVTAWVNGMLERRPFGSRLRVIEQADDVWWSLGPEDWREAFDHHPRIGERKAAAEQSDQAREWSAGEQQGVRVAALDVQEALARGNQEYERKFGHIYLVYAWAKSAEELLAILRDRLTNDASTELRVAAGEQAKITRSRLMMMFGPPK